MYIYNNVNIKGSRCINFSIANSTAMDKACRDLFTSAAIICMMHTSVLVVVEL